MIRKSLLNKKLWTFDSWINLESNHFKKRFESTFSLCYSKKIATRFESRIIDSDSLQALLSWLKTLHGYPNAIYENLGTSVHADVMVWVEINLLNKGGLKMNLAFLISFMTFHFYLNLAFHTNIFTIRIVIVIYFIFLKKILIRLALYPYSNLFGSSKPAQTEHFQNQALQKIF